MAGISVDKTFFNFYSNKARDVVNNRNFFVTIYLTSLLTIFIPLVYQIPKAAEDNGSTITFSLLSFLQTNLIAGGIFLIILVAIGGGMYFFCESKYREYRWNYTQIAVKYLVNEIIKPDSPLPKTIDDLCKIIEDKTQFSPEHIMPILKMMGIYEEGESPKQAIP